MTILITIIINNKIKSILGSGSDYTVFLDHFGIPSLDFSYTKKNAGGTYGVYHSIYDSFNWMNKYGGCTSTSPSTSSGDRDTRNSDENENNDYNCNAFELIEFASKIWGLLGTYTYNTVLYCAVLYLLNDVYTEEEKEKRLSLSLPLPLLLLLLLSQNRKIHHFFLCHLRYLLSSCFFLYLFIYIKQCDWQHLQSYQLIMLFKVIL